jgi:tryptophan-rich sensory protein
MRQRTSTFRTDGAERRRAIVVAALATLAVAGAGALATDLGPWYFALKEPAWKPADAWFGPAWTVIYTLTAAAALQAWLHAPTRRARRAVLSATALNALLNVAWSVLFFRARRPDWALAEVVLLWLSIVGMAVVFGQQRTSAAVLLVPYLLWVAFAAALNAAVVDLNAPFGAAS